MNRLDDHIVEIEAFVQSTIDAGRQVREWNLPERDTLVGDIGPSRNRMVFARDTAAELGHPTADSCLGVLWTSDSDLVSDGRVRLIGPDLAEIVGQHSPLGQIVVLGSSGFGEDTEPFALVSLRMVDGIPGVMSRISPDTAWYRMSRGAVDGGLDFRALGREMMRNWKRNIPEVESIEILFVTSDSADLERLKAIARAAHEVTAAMRTADWRRKGIDLSCAISHCGSCADQSACTAIARAGSLSHAG